MHSLPSLDIAHVVRGLKGVQQHILCPGDPQWMNPAMVAAIVCSIPCFLSRHPLHKPSRPRLEPASDELDRQAGGPIRESQPDHIV